MKPQLIILMLTCLIVFTTCSKDDDLNPKYKVQLMYYENGVLNENINHIEYYNEEGWLVRTEYEADITYNYTDSIVEEHHNRVTKINYDDNNNVTKIRMNGVDQSYEHYFREYNYVYNDMGQLIKYEHKDQDHQLVIEFEPIQNGVIYAELIEEEFDYTQDFEFYYSNNQLDSILSKSNDYHYFLSEYYYNSGKLISVNSFSVDNDDRELWATSNFEYNEFNRITRCEEFIYSNWKLHELSYNSYHNWDEIITSHENHNGSSTCKFVYDSEINTRLKLPTGLFVYFREFGFRGQDTEYISDISKMNNPYLLKSLLYQN